MYIYMYICSRHMYSKTSTLRHGPRAQGSFRIKHTYEHARAQDSPRGVDHVSQSRDAGPLQKMHVGCAAAYVGGEEHSQALAHGVVGLAACEV